MEVEGGKKKSRSGVLRWMKKSTTTTRGMMRKSKSWSGGGAAGWLSVYVGAERQRFVIKTEAVNHPLFKMLLEDAELEYGFNSDGPLLLPCHVDLFCSILAEMDDFSDARSSSSSSCRLITQGFACHTPFSPARRRLRGGASAYGLLTPHPSFN